MYRWKRWIAVVLLVCMAVSLMPQTRWAKAATMDTPYYYELDTDGIDPGAQYLILSDTKVANPYALKMNSSNIYQLAKTQVEVIDGKYVAPFADESSCLWTISSSQSGTVFCSGYYLNVESSYVRYQSSPSTIQFHHFGDGEYGFYTGGGTGAYLRYLRYATNNFDISRSYGQVGTEKKAYQGVVRLFKLVENDQGVTLTYDAANATAGTVPAAEEGLEKGRPYTVKAPSADLRKDVGVETYLFRCWNTQADGSGTEYDPGDTITLTEDVTLYAQWYLQAKYQVLVITDLNDVPTDIEDIDGEAVQLYIRLDAQGSDLIPLERTAEGHYSAWVTENGTYLVYAQAGDEEPVAAHGHKVIIYNQGGSTELLNYSVSYDAAGGSWSGEAPSGGNYHANTQIVATDLVPVKEGCLFRGWMDQKGNVYGPQQLITDALKEQLVLTAVWEDLITVTVNVRIDHNAKTTGQDNDQSMHEVIFSLLRVENGADLLVEEKILTEGYVYDRQQNVTTYQVVFQGMPQGIYHVSGVKSFYETTATYSGEANQNQVIDLNLKYAPENFDLVFNVKVQGGEKTLMPKAVNVKVTYWGYNQDDVLGWHTITQQAGDNAPVTVFIDENGQGTGYFPVWRYWSGGRQAYDYRVEISSFLMPDGSIVAASGDFVTYTANGSGLYTATVSVENGGRVPAYPAGSNTDLAGAYFDGNVQVGVPVITVDITPFTVTFDAGDGTLDGKKTVVLQNQFAYPDLAQYIPDVPDEHSRFTGWYVNGILAENLAGSYLTGNVTYVAKFTQHAVVKGDVFIAGTYEQDGKLVPIKDIDRVTSLMVVLEKNINGVYNDVDSQIVNITYVVDEKGDYGYATYSFEQLPNDGTQYAVRVVTHNYSTVYNNNGDTEGSDAERLVVLNEENVGVVDVYMLMTPALYTQWAEVDTSRIAEGFRPSTVEVSYLHRDMDGARPYAVIAQHVEKGFTLTVDADGVANSFFNVWKGNNTGAVSEYQLRVNAIFGDETIPYDENAPYTVDYGVSSWWSETKGEEENVLTATLIPKEYEIIFDLNADGDAVKGLEHYLLDSNDGQEKYGYVHTWSKASSFSAFPYRQGYEFAGWIVANEGVDVKNCGDVYVAPAVAEELVLVASWTKLSGTDYTIRFLEQNTDKVLKGAVTVTGSVFGSNVYARDLAMEYEVPGYVYTGALIRGTYYEKTQRAPMLVLNDPLNNQITLYYTLENAKEQEQEKVVMHKDTVLENNGTYTINLDLQATNPPVITILERDTPLDIVLVLDQSGSMVQSNFLDDMQLAVNNFVNQIADHGRSNNVDHRIAVVGYAGDESAPPTDDDTNRFPIAGGTISEWVNTGVFDSNGDFYPYPVTGFNYTEYTGQLDPQGTYYTYSDGEYLLLTYHAEYRHLITEQEAKVALLSGETVYGYVFDEAGNGSFVELTRNTSGLWLYGDKQLYSLTKFFTYHTDVWTHRSGTDRRQIHGYGTFDNYASSDGHQGVFTRTETRADDVQLSIYKDALVPVSVGADGSGGVNPGLTKSVSHLASNGPTYVQYGVEMANRVFEANPLDETEGRVRVMIIFTDGMPGSGIFDDTVADAAVEKAYITKNTYGAHTYAIGLYPATSVNATDNQAYFMNALSSNYPDAKKLEDVRSETYYAQVADGNTLSVGGPYYTYYNGDYYVLNWTVRWVQTGIYTGEYLYSWAFTVNGQLVDVTTDQHAPVTDGKIGDYNIYRKMGTGYQPTDYSGYYSTTDSEQNLKDYFELVMHEITTRITTKVRLREDTVLRDILGSGLVLQPGAKITAYKVAGTYDEATDTITWASAGEQLAQVVIPQQADGPLQSAQTTTIRYEDENGNEVVQENVPYITVYNLDGENPYDPDEPNYRPHSVDVTGYDFEQWYDGLDENARFKVEVTIQGAEATDAVEYGRAAYTNGADSGLWSEEDENGERSLLVRFEQPTTIFVERAYVLDYGKEFTLSGWYFDDEDGKDAEAIHLDCDTGDGMNAFDPTKPNTANAVNGAYGNTQYGNVRIENGKVVYTPVTTQWGGSDSFYVYGNTWRKTVLAQEANSNGNLWNKVTVIPANNIYFEDTFITTDGGAVNGISGFTFTGAWDTVYTTDESGANNNAESPEHQEGLPYGDVHGWTNDLADDTAYSDGSAHGTSTPGAEAEFTFTGTGVDVYTRTNDKSGMVVAILSKDGQMVQGIVMDNLAVSGDYYQVPTISFRGLAHGTYQVRLIATTAQTDDVKRYEYYIDGIRIFDPLGKDTGYENATIRDAYGKELNAYFREVRDILLDAGSFTADTGETGAVFVDWIRQGQGTGADQVGKAQTTYVLGTFEKYGPKNEVYLAAGQSIVLKLDTTRGNYYYVGLKSLDGKQVQAAVSMGDNDPAVINITHTTDMYYAVQPTADGYVVIRNIGGEGKVLSITDLRITNLTEHPENSILSIQETEALEQAEVFTQKLEDREMLVGEAYRPHVSENATTQQVDLVDALFTAVRQWLDAKSGQ